MIGTRKRLCNQVAVIDVPPPPPALEELPGIEACFEGYLKDF